MTRPDTRWMDHAACAGHADLGWMKEPEDVGLGEESTMAVICGRCSVRADCEHYVLASEVTAGFWAGHHRTPMGPLLPLTGDAA